MAAKCIFSFLLAMCLTQGLVAYPGSLFSLPSVGDLAQKRVNDACDRMNEKVADLKQREDALTPAFMNNIYAGVDQLNNLNKTANASVASKVDSSQVKADVSVCYDDQEKKIQKVIADAISKMRVMADQATALGKPVRDQVAAAEQKNEALANDTKQKVADCNSNAICVAGVFAGADPQALLLALEMDKLKVELTLMKPKVASMSGTGVPPLVQDANQKTEAIAQETVECINSKNSQ